MGQVAPQTSAYPSAAGVLGPALTQTIGGQQNIPPAFLRAI